MSNRYAVVEVLSGEGESHRERNLSIRGSSLYALDREAVAGDAGFERRGDDMTPGVGMKATAVVARVAASMATLLADRPWHAVVALSLLLFAPVLIVVCSNLVVPWSKAKGEVWAARTRDVRGRATGTRPARPTIEPESVRNTPRSHRGTTRAVAISEKRGRRRSDAHRRRAVRESGQEGGAK
jgi:hypothetical protein